jgi:hypothetical protein
MPAFYRQLFPDCRGRLRFRSIKWGSLILLTEVNLDGAGKISEASSAIQTSIATNGIDGVVIQKVTVTTTGTN